MQKILRGLSGLGLLLAAVNTSYASDIELLGGFQGDFEAAMEDLTAAFSFKGLQPSEPLGTLGFHAGVIASYTGIENEDAWRRISGGQDFEDLGIVALAAGKGLPFGFDVGGFLADVPDSNVSLYGVELRYAYAEGGLIAPAISVRAAYTKLEGVDELDFDTKSIDVSISKGLTFITPYVGAGRVFGTATPNGLPGLSEAEINENKLYAGLRFSLLLLKFVFEADKTGDNSSYNLRVALGF